MITKRQLQEWNRQTWESKHRAMYETHGRNRWPWFFEQLDPDIEAHLVASGAGARDVLDIGTCSGAQAIELAKRAHRVVGTEVSATALGQAKQAAAGQAGLSLELLLDDIADSCLGDRRFDLVVDRGCYQSICSFNHDEYVASVKRVLKPGGVLLLKVMSSAEQRFATSAKLGDRDVPMPFHFTAEQLQRLFSPHFIIEQLRDSCFHSSVIDVPARARLVVLRNESWAPRTAS